MSQARLSPRSVRFLTISYQDGLVESPVSDGGASQREFRQTVVYKVYRADWQRLEFPGHSIHALAAAAGNPFLTTGS